MSGDGYIALQGQIVRLTPDAVLFAVGHGMARHSAWVPRTCVHEAERPGLDRMTKIDRVALRVEEWKARELGLVNTKIEGGAVGDLFDGGAK